MNIRNIIVGVAVGMVVMGFALAIIGRFVESEAPSPPTRTISTPSEPTVAGFTRAEYLDKVSNGGQDQMSLCSYTYLIDNFGLEETYRMDVRATVDETDVDPRIYEAMGSCL